MYRVIKTDWYQVISTRGTVVAETDTEEKATDIAVGFSIVKAMKILEPYEPSTSCGDLWARVTLFKKTSMSILKYIDGKNIYSALTKAVEYVAEMEADNGPI